MKIKLAIIFCLVSLLSFSQTSFVINNVRVFDGENVKENVSVLIKDGKIKKVSSRKLRHNNIIDGTEKTLLPALTNSHVHIWSPASLQQAAKAGVLNVLDMHAVESVIPMLKPYRDSTNYANYYTSGAAATVPGGHGTQYGFPTPTLSKPDEAANFVKGRMDAGAHYLKIIQEPWKVTLDAKTVAALVKATHKLEMKAVVHISKVKDAYQVLIDKADGLVHIWDDKEMTKIQLEDLKKETFFVVPTLLTIQKVQKAYFNKTEVQTAEKTVFIQKELKKLYDIGVPILAGTDPPNANINFGTDLYKEMELLKGAGLSNIDVLKSATSLPALHFDLKNIGFIKKGYNADLILVDGNPVKNLKDMWNTKRIFKNGVEVK